MRRFLWSKNIEKKKLVTMASVIRSLVQVNRALLKSLAWSMLTKDSLRKKILQDNFLSSPRTSYRLFLFFFFPHLVGPQNM